MHFRFSPTYLWEKCRANIRLKPPKNAGPVGGPSWGLCHLQHLNLEHNLNVPSQHDQWIVSGQGLHLLPGFLWLVDFVVFPPEPPPPPTPPEKTWLCLARKSSSDHSNLTLNINWFLSWNRENWVPKVLIPLIQLKLFMSEVKWKEFLMAPTPFLQVWDTYYIPALLPLHPNGPGYSVQMKLWHSSSKVKPDRPICFWDLVCSLSELVFFVV